MEFYFTSNYDKMPMSPMDGVSRFLLLNKANFCSIKSKKPHSDIWNLELKNSFLVTVLI